ncbi:diacylglycerol/lipid kinase family protein [Saccharicrinis sp. FJH54]|uniref:diacylglycerol/lipid kinase family protein n=1 Tax=Saccharicrinis sp. FJH54 TaxID=3344665 RepID=UPI0035D463A9
MLEKTVTLKTLLLINPVAGISRKKKVLHQLRTACNNTDYIITKYPGHIREIFDEKRNEYDLFVAVGGDGTFNELVSSAIHSDKLVAVLPYGSGNGFAREFGFGKSLKKLLRTIEKGEYLEVDSLDVNGRISVNVTGTGFDSKIAHVFHRMKKRGFWSYFYSTLKTILFIKSIDAEIITNRKNCSGSYLLISAANNKQYGNNAIISPKASLFDGKFELLLFRPFPKILFPYFAIQVFLGSLRQSKYVEYLQGLEYAEIKTEFNQFHIDGEAVEIESPVHIAIKPRSLKVLKTDKFR